MSQCASFDSSQPRYLVLASLRQLTILAHVARHSSFTKAARELDITQPLVSRQLKILEKWLGAKLFRKTHKGVELTEAGFRCLKHAEAIVSQVRKLGEEFGIERGDSLAPTLKVGGTYNPSVSLLPSILTVFKKSHPTVEVSLRTAIQSRIEEMLLHADVEIAVVSGAVSSPHLIAEPFRRETLVLFVAKGNALARRKKLHLTDLDRLPLVIRGGQGGQGSTEQVLNQLKNSGIQPKITLRFSSPEAVKTAVKKKAGAGILYRSVIAAELETGDFKILPVNNLNLEGDSFIVYHKERALSPQAQDLLALLYKRRRKAKGGVKGKEQGAGEHGKKQDGIV